MDFNLPHLPPTAEIETTAVLKQLTKSHRYLAELKGTVKTIPNEHILINTLALQEANIIGKTKNTFFSNEMSKKNKALMITLEPIFYLYFKFRLNSV
ncbi:Fic/DOC family N-terminal domain-containing protein [Riemerella anatipestifer]|uniref:Fic/DOC family N-terminal domain-containing protein n=1 Tax=Riemerella anatipestifer TaxID=34085 RepID=UPI0021AAC71B|nr:Fic/DOC family N-terminal domain-containing protein [Riemerella anatipestifer]